MSTRLKPCPFDASTNVAVEELEGEFYVHCKDCGANGPTADSWAEAEKLWNKRTTKRGGDGGRA